MEPMANFLSIFRIILVLPGLFLLFNGYQFWALGVFLAAMGTDVADGWIARKFGKVTTLGKWLDPMADKIMVLALLVAFFIRGEMPWWGFFMMSRDALFLLGFFFLFLSKKRFKPIPPTYLGKMATLLQTLTLAILFIIPIPKFLILLTCAMSAASGFQYLKRDNAL